MVYKFNIGQNEEISKLCKISNNLYNQALYIFRGMLSKEGKWLSYFELDSIMKNTKNLDGDINYKLLKAQCSQQILRVLDKTSKDITNQCKIIRSILINTKENHVFHAIGKEVRNFIYVTRIKVARLNTERLSYQKVFR